MQEQTAEIENTGVENCRSDKIWKPSENNTLKYHTKYGCRGFPHPNLFVFLGYMQYMYITIDSVRNLPLFMILKMLIMKALPPSCLAIHFWPIHSLIPMKR